MRNTKPRHLQTLNYATLGQQALPNRSGKTRRVVFSAFPQFLLFPCYHFSTNSRRSSMNSRVLGSSLLLLCVCLLLLCFSCCLTRDLCLPLRLVPEPAGTGS